ncbi:MAG: NAD(P)-dependent alcohol dehydrogenase [Anaerolineae bacterium]
MKAIIWTNYGSPDVFQLQEVDKPTPKDNEVLIKVHAATAFAGDCELRRLDLPLLIRVPLRLYAGLIKPKRVTVLGQELAGEIEAVGKAVTKFKKGDQIFASAGLRFGAYAEYKCLPESAVISIKPASISYDEAAAIPTGGTEALHYLRKGNIQKGEQILINGAGGSIGTFVVQLAKHFGAEVTAVDHADKLDMLRSIGADHVIDYTHEDFAAKEERYDLVFDSVGKKSFERCVKALKPDGRYLLASPNPRTRIRGRRVSRSSGKKVIIESVEPTIEDLNYLAGLIEAGTIKVVIDKRYPLEQTAEAHRYVESGQKKGHVIITV